MNITEANQVARLVHLLDGSNRGRNVDQLLEAVTSLAERAAKPLQVVINVNEDQARANIRTLLGPCAHDYQPFQEGIVHGYRCTSCGDVQID